MPRNKHRNPATTITSWPGVTQAGTPIEAKIAAIVAGLLPPPGGAAWVEQSTSATSGGGLTDYGPDHFAYADGALAAVAPTNWEPLSGFGDLNVASSKLKPNTGGVDGVVRLTATAFGTMNASQQWAMLKLDSFAQFNGPTVFSDDIGTFYYCDCRNSDVHLYRVIGGVFTDIGNAAIGWASGDLAYIDADSLTDVTKTTVRIYKGGLPGTGSLALSVPDSNVARILSGRQGIRMYFADASGRIDDFSAGDFTSAGALDNFDLDGALTYLRADGAAPFFSGFTVDGSTPIAGNQVLLENVGSGLVTVGHQDIGSTAANRVITATGADLDLVPTARALGIYDDVTDRWRMAIVGTSDVTLARALTIASLRG